MADAYEQNLASKSTLTTTDYIRVVGSDNVSYKQLVSDVAKKIIENYTGSTLAGSAQSVKSAVDSLNSKTAYASYDLQTVLPLTDRIGRIMKFGSQISLYAQIGSLTLTAGSNTIGTLSNFYPSSTEVCVCGFVGAGTGTGTPVRVTIDTSGEIKCFAPSALTGTLRFSASYATTHNS